MLFGEALVEALIFTKEIPLMEPVLTAYNSEEPLIALVLAERCPAVKPMPESMPNCDTVELSFFFASPVIEALMEGEVAVTRPASTVKGVHCISTSWYVCSKGACVPSVAAQTASVLPENRQSPE